MQRMVKCITSNVSYFTIYIDLQSFLKKIFKLLNCLFIYLGVKYNHDYALDSVLFMSFTHSIHNTVFTYLKHKGRVQLKNCLLKMAL